jgi:hypothetical protein
MAGVAAWLPRESMSEILWQPTEEFPMSWKRRAVAVAMMTVLLGAGAAPAFADAPNGNSGHVGNNANQCKNGQDHCPPFGP